MTYCSAYGCSNSSVRNGELFFFFPLETTGSIEAMDSQLRVLLHFRPAPRNNIKMITYDDQTSQGVSTTPVLRVCTCQVIQNNINA